MAESLMNPSFGSKDDQPPQPNRVPQFKRSATRLLRDVTYSVPEVLIPQISPLHVYDLQCSRTPVSAMEGIALSELLLEQNYPKKYVILRSLVPPRGGECLSTIVEDHLGTGAIFALQNAIAGKQTSVEDILPIGTVFILKAPFLTQNKEGDCILRCESPSNMVVVSEIPELVEVTSHVMWKAAVSCPVHVAEPRNPRLWKSRGMQYFKDGKNTIATLHLLNAVDNAYELLVLEECPLVDELLQEVYVDLSDVYLARGLLEKAFHYAQKVTDKMDCWHEKGHLNAGKACEQLRNYKKALEYIKIYHREHPRYRCGIDLYEGLKTRVSEEETGKFDLRELNKKKYNEPLMPIPMADYTGPVVINSLGNRGRGLVATEDIEPGTLLIAAKALAFSWKSDITHPVKLECWKDLVAQLAVLITTNPKTFGPIILELSDGKNPVTREYCRVFCDEDAQLEPIVDAKRLKDIVLNNAFGDTDDLHHTKLTLRGMPDRVSGCGVFNMPSYLNHSCLPNAHVLYFNDVMHVRASKAIKAGEEVCIAYISGEHPFLNRAAFCASRGFDCYCQLCQLERTVASTNLLNRQRIFSKYEYLYGLVSSPQIDFRPDFVRDIDALLEELKSTLRPLVQYPQTIALVSMYALRCKAHSMESCDDPQKYSKEIEDHLETLRCLGLDDKKLLECHRNGASVIPANDCYVLDLSTLFACRRLLYVYAGINMRNEASEWEAILSAFEHIYTGEPLKNLQMTNNIIALTKCPSSNPSLSPVNLNAVPKSLMD